MFIVNLKLNTKRIVYTVILLLIIILVIFSISNSNIIPTLSSKLNKVDINVTTNNFTEQLQTIYDNIDENVNKTIKVTGYVFRLQDFEENQLVIGRDYILTGEDKVVGFMCQSEKPTELKDNIWYEITGKIIKGDYHGDIPIIQIESFKMVNTPKNTYVTDKNKQQAQNNQN